MQSLSDIQQIIRPELEHFEQHFRESMRSKVALLDRIMYYIVKRKGKQARPMFVFLSARLCGETRPETFIAASLVELLHTATLVHDDVVDSSMIRRGFFSINALWKNKVAVLVGDYLLSKGLLLALENKQFQMLEILSGAVRDMSEGELLQMEKARKLDIEEDVYFDIIRKKTASLIAAACGCGACSVTSDPAQIERLIRLGDYIGTAFQIKDDLFDFGSQDVGKPLGIDIREKKMTLPLIHALKRDPSHKSEIIRLIRKDKVSREDTARVIAYVRENGGLEYADMRMREYQEKAYSLLADFPESVERRAMEGLIRYVTEREK